MMSWPCSLPQRSSWYAALCASVLGLAACDGGAQDMSTRATVPAQLELATAARFAQGPVGKACLTYNRQSADTNRCGCIQAAADLTLSQSEQKRAARFFADPELLQKMKLSDTPRDERFWDTWANFADTAELLCESV